MEVTLEGYRLSELEKCSKWIVVMVAQLCEYTKNHQIVHITKLNFKLCKFCVNKAVILYKIKK